MSLRARLFLTLLAVNSVVLGTLAWWAAGDEVQQEETRARRQLQLQNLVRERLSRFDPSLAGDLASILDWPGWQEFEDALIIDNRVLRLNDAVVPVGAYVNPLGSRHRARDFPLQEITRAIARAASTSEPIAVGAGLAIPLVTTSAAGGERRIWGGVYLQPPALPAAQPFWARIVLAAALATVAGGGLLYLLLGRTVLRPVERLAGAAHEFAGGGAPRLPEDVRAREISELVQSFGSMVERIRGFQGELHHEVEAATQRAQQAERRAARQERLAAMGTLAAGLAHEINSPLAGALQGLEIVRGEAATEKAVRYADLTQDALQRIGSLVQRLLQLAPARVEAGSCSLQEAVRDLPDFLASRLQRHRLELELPDAPLEVRGAPGDLFPVFLNLVQNSLDALEEGAPVGGGRVRLTARAADAGGADVEVTDDGPGVDPELLPHLFEPFVTTKEVGLGTGLGLALAHATIRQLGGSLEADNLDGGGFRVRIHLPGPAGA